MLQTLFTAAAAAAPTQNTSGNGATPEAGEEDSPEGQAHSMMNALGASMPLLPGINLFNPAQAKLLQQQMQAQNFSTTNQAFPVAKVRGVKTAKQGALNLHSSRGSTSSNGHPDSESKANMGDFTFPGKHNQNTSGKHTSQQQKQASSSHRSNIVASSSAHPASEPMSHSHLPHPISQMQNHHQQSGPRMKYWKDGCLKCSKTYSVGWRVKQTRKKALDGTILQPNMLPEDGKIAKLCEGMSSPTPFRRGPH